MAFMDYQQTRPWAKAIKAAVLQKLKRVRIYFSCWKTSGTERTEAPLAGRIEIGFGKNASC